MYDEKVEILEKDQERMRDIIRQYENDEAKKQFKLRELFNRWKVMTEIFKMQEEKGKLQGATGTFVMPSE